MRKLSKRFRQQGESVINPARNCINRSSLRTDSTRYCLLTGRVHDPVKPSGWYALTSLKVSLDIGESYHDPISFVECAIMAEKYGFDTVWFGDHLLPWTHSRKRSSFVWSVMPVALDRTKNLHIGVFVTVPIGGRYHPVIVAQAAATLDNMYPGRFSLGVGSGEAMSDGMFFPEGWPKWNERIERLAEAIRLIRKAWESEDYFTFEGKYFKLENFFLYTKPKTRIPICFSALGRKSAAYAGTYGDDLITISSPENCRDVIFPSFEASARSAGKDPTKMEKMVAVNLQFFKNKKDGVEELRRNGEAGLLLKEARDEKDPRMIEKMSQSVSSEKILAGKNFISSPEEVIELTERYRKIGATQIIFDIQSFGDRIEFLGEKVMPFFLQA